MPSLKKSLAQAALLLAAATVANVAAAHTADAQVRERSRTVSVQGPARGATLQQDRVRSPGFSSRTREITTSNGQTYASSLQRETVRTDSGFETTALRTGPRGGVQTYDRSATRTDDGYARTAELQTSSGRGYSATGDASRSEEGVTVDRSLTTNNGSTFSATHTYARPD